MSGGDDEDDGLPGICEGSFDACAAPAADNGFISPEEEGKRVGAGQMKSEGGRGDLQAGLGEAVKLSGGGGANGFYERSPMRTLRFRNS